MIKATARMADGRHVLLLGLSARNVELLRDGKPIYFDLATLQSALPAGEPLGPVAIFYGATEAALTEALSPLIQPNTSVVVVPKGSDEPQ